MYDTTLAKAEFAEWSRSYDRSILQLLLFGPSHRAIIRRLKDQFGDRPFRVLDVGCGTGVFAERMRAALPNAQIWGVDLVSAMLEKGKARYQAHSGHIVPIQGNSEQLPFANSSFDIVTCCNSFHHYPHQDKAVAEMRRVLVPGGKLMLIDGYRDMPWGWMIYDVCVAGVEGEVHHCSAKRFRELFKSAGLIETDQKVHRGFAPFILNQAVAPSVIPLPHIALGTEAGVRSKSEAAATPRPR
jgi:ubiquinone/menaquinone biosynthesis C-methylase UbiE